MRFLVDVCTGPGVSSWLALQGHDTVSIYDASPGMTDDLVLEYATAENQILITNDRAFGEMIFRDGNAHRGIVFMRLDDERPSNKIRVLETLLSSYSDQLADRFVVVSEFEVRFADS